jgi:hypothetical protein
VQVEGDDLSDARALVTSNDEEPTDEDRETASKIFKGDEEFVTKSEAAGTLGDISPGGARIRKAYMDLFDWSGFNILLAMRDLCGKLILKAESQQVDRILMAFTERWCECNPSHGFKASGKKMPPSRARMVTNLPRCCSHHLLLCSAPQHRLASRRYRIKDDSKPVR